jgi:hypothetical protein
MKTFCIGECPSNSVTMGLGSIIFKEWRDTRTFSNLKSTHCTIKEEKMKNINVRKMFTNYLN